MVLVFGTPWRLFRQRIVQFKFTSAADPPLETDGGKEMSFPVLIQEFVGPNGRGHAMILMREDGAFEGLILRSDRAAKLEHACWEHRIEDYEVCAVADTRTCVEEMICEELGL
jgi:hypothetical protein